MEGDEFSCHVLIKKILSGIHFTQKTMTGIQSGYPNYNWHFIPSKGQPIVHKSSGLWFDFNIFPNADKWWSICQPNNYYWNIWSMFLDPPRRWHFWTTRSLMPPDASRTCRTCREPQDTRWSARWPLPAWLLLRKTKGFVGRLNIYTQY